MIGCLLLCVLAFSTRCTGAVICPFSDEPGIRVDFQTILLSPSAREGHLQTDIFFGFHVSEKVRHDKPFSILVPVDGIPLSVKAQAMTLSEFDRRYTHATDMESGFYARVRAERAGRTCLYTSIAATAGPPAWFLLAPRWPPKGPPLTAVIPAPQAEGNLHHSVHDVRITTRDDALRDMSGLLASRSLRALRNSESDYLIETSFTPVRTSDRRMKEHATKGIRISYEAPLQNHDDEWRMQLPLLRSPSSTSVALTRIYVSMPANRNIELDIPEDQDTPASPQGLVNGVLGAFGYSDAFRASTAQARAGTSVSSVRTAHGGKTTRVVASFAHSDAALSLRMSKSAAGPARTAAAALGALLLGLLWPLALILYAAGLWATARAYFWMISLPKLDHSPRKMAILAGLFPILTPWIALRFLAPAGDLPHDGDESGALGVLPMRYYDCVARLVLWGALICANWAILESVLRLALHLRFE